MTEGLDNIWPEPTERRVREAELERRELQIPDRRKIDCSIDPDGGNRRIGRGPRGGSHSAAA